MNLTIRQRRHLGTMLGNSANVILGALVVGQFVEGSVRWLSVATGACLYLLIAVVTTGLQKIKGVKEDAII